MTWTTRQRSKTGSIASIRTGDGPMVVLVHGVGLRAEAWGAQIDELSQTHKVIAVDMPGHGHSDSLPDGAELANFTDCIAASFDDPAIVIGHSFGAMIALDMAIRNPDKVKGVVALNAIFQRDAAAKAAVMHRANSLDGATNAEPTATLRRWFGTEMSASRAACSQWLQETNPAGYRCAYRVFANEDGPRDASLQSLICPALFITGAEEPNSTPTMSKNMANLVPNGQLQVFANAAHMLPMTHAAQLNKSLAAFIQSIPERM